MSTATCLQNEQYVAFRLAGETYGVPILLTHEIIRTREITRIPRTPDFLRGVVNLRGTVVPVVDLRVRLGFEAAEETPETRIVMVEVDPGVVGMIVDSVSQVVRIPHSQIDPPNDLMRGHETELFLGVGKMVTGSRPDFDTSQIGSTAEDTATDTGTDIILLLDVSKALRRDDER